MVSVNNLTVRSSGKIVLDAVSCMLVPGRITCFIGKSGAGKTTLLQSCIQVRSDVMGQILIDGRSLNTLSAQERSETIGYVFQHFNLFLNLTVIENCIDPLMMRGVSQEEARARAKQYLEMLDMTQYADRYPSMLSGGQQQRVAIARALCLKPSVLLLDEPTASLDPINTDILITILRSLAADGLIIGVASQDMDFVRKIFDRVYYLESGKIIEFCDGKQELEQCPAMQKFLS